jgi:hypothetical protein
VGLAWIELIDAAATHEGTSQRPPSATAGLGYIQHSAAGCSRVGSLLLPAGGASVHEHADRVPTSEHGEQRRRWIVALPQSGGAAAPWDVDRC